MPNNITLEKALSALKETYENIDIRAFFRKTKT